MIKVPQFKTFPEVTKFLTEYIRGVDRDSKDVLHSHKANKSLLLYSKAGSVFEITVSNAGALEVTELRQNVDVP